jgi:hypothetical protein
MTQKKIRGIRDADGKPIVLDEMCQVNFMEKTCLAKVSHYFSANKVVQVQMGPIGKGAFYTVYPANIRMIKAKEELEKMRANKRRKSKACPEIS